MPTPGEAKKKIISLAWLYLGVFCRRRTYRVSRLTNRSVNEDVEEI